jgi:hypothetical protein
MGTFIKKNFGKKQIVTKENIKLKIVSSCHCWNKKTGLAHGKIHLEQVN